MIHLYLSGAIQNDQSRRRARSIGVEILLAQRHRHLQQGAVITLAHRFYVRPFLFGRDIGSLGRVAVELSWTDDDQAFGSELLPQAGDNRDFGFAVHTPMRPEE